MMNPYGDLDLGQLYRQREGNPMDNAAGNPAGNPRQEMSANDRLGSLQLDQSERLRMQKLRMAQSSVQQQLDEGHITPDEARAFGDQIATGLAPLQARHEASEKLGRQAAKEQLQDEMATVAVAKNTSDAFMATNLTNRINQWTDPQSGETHSIFVPATGPPVSMSSVTNPNSTPPPATTPLGGAFNNAPQFNAIFRMVDQMTPPVSLGPNATPVQLQEAHQARQNYIIQQMGQFASAINPPTPHQQQQHLPMQFLGTNAAGQTVTYHPTHGITSPQQPMVPGMTGGQFSQPIPPSAQQIGGIAGMIGQGPGMGGLGMAADTAPSGQIPPPPGFPPSLIPQWNTLSPDQQAAWSGYSPQQQQGIIAMLSGQQLMPGGQQGQQPQGAPGGTNVPAGGQSQPGQGSGFSWVQPGGAHSGAAATGHGAYAPHPPSFPQWNSEVNSYLDLHPGATQAEAEAHVNGRYSSYSSHYGSGQPGQGSGQGSGQGNVLSGQAPTFSGSGMASFNPTMAFTHNELPQMSEGGSLTVPSGDYRGQWTSEYQHQANNLHQAATQTGNWQMVALVGFTSQLLHHYGSVSQMPTSLRNQYNQAMHMIQQLGSSGGGISNPGTQQQFQPPQPAAQPQAAGPQPPAPFAQPQAQPPGPVGPGAFHGGLSSF